MKAVDATGAAAPDHALNSAMHRELGAAAGSSAAAAGSAAEAGSAAQTAGKLGDASAMVPTSDEPAHVGRETLGSSPLPCELRTVLETSCQGCHARNPGALAPMALTSREDLLGPSISQPERQVHELIKERVHDANAPMPPPSSRKLTVGELTTLNQVSEELTLGPMQCTGSTARRADFPPPDPSEIEQCYPFHAYATSGELDKPFRVANGESYGCFAFDIPWPADAQAVSVRVRTSPIVHHWRLLDQRLGLPQGSVLVAPIDCSVGTTTTYANVDVTDVKEINMPPTVGLQLPAPSGDLKMMLNVHYFNMGAPTDDMSGAEVCVARKPREHTAGVHIVQANSFSLPPRQATKVTTLCTPKYSGDIHIIQSLPHMHTRGTRLETIVQRTNGTTETLIDVPFDFNNQILYQADMVLRPGDKLLTTCHYQNDTDRTIYPGVSTEDEMCLNDITAWPAGSLYSGVTPDGTKGCYE